MKTTKILTIVVVALGLIMCQARLSEAAPMGTAFTYQGHLYDDNQVADGLYDFQFKLFDDPNVAIGIQVGSDVNVPDVDVIDALFTVELDFNDPCAFNGDARWLEIGVRPGDQSDPCEYTILEPRQAVTPTPYAIYAAESNGLTLPYSGVVSTAASAFLVRNTGGGKAIQGIGENNDGVAGGSYTADRSGVFGYNDNADGFGVFGSSINGTGVKGYTYGITGKAGLFYIQNVNNSNNALEATTDGSGGAVFGINNSNGNYGYLGDSNSGAGGYSRVGYGVYGESTDSYGGYFKSADSNGIGVFGEANYPGEETYELTYGGYFTSLSRYGAGVYGQSTHSYGGKGVYGYASGNAGVGVYGQTSGNINSGVLGYCTNSSSGKGVIGTASGQTGMGVVGVASNDGDYENYGGYFEAQGRYGQGVHGNSTGSDGVGVYGEATGGGKAGYFDGDVHVTGELTKAYTAGTSNPAAPIAYAFIGSDGVKDSGTPNVTSTWNAGSEYYEITISGENYYYNSYVTVVTLSGGTTGVARTSSVGGKLIVAIYNLSGTPTQSHFQFVTYKP